MANYQGLNCIMGEITMIARNEKNPIHEQHIYGFTSDAQNMMTEIDYKSILANLIVAEGDLEENWKNVIAEYAYIVDPAVAELNELFGAK